jgi:DNA modification methylase
MKDSVRSEHTSVERLHRLHSYCARFPSEIAEAAIDQFTTAGDSIYDPFCGSGTSLVAGLARKRHVVGSDIDVLAGMLSEIKCSPLPADNYKVWRRRFESTLRSLFEEISDNWPPERLPRPGRPLSIGSLNLPVAAFPQLNYWFPPQLIAYLAAIASAAHRCRSPHYEQVALVSLSAAIISKWPNSLSYAMDIDHTRPHRRIQRFTGRRVLDSYLDRLDRTIACLGGLNQVYDDAGILASLPHAARVVCPHDARKPLPDILVGSQALVVTSPPYYSAVDYPRAHRLSVCWMNGHAPAALASRQDYIGLRHLGDFKAAEWLKERKEVQRLIPEALSMEKHGRRLAAFFADLESVLEQTWRILRPSGHALFVIGDNTVGGHGIKSHQALADLAKARGFLEIHRKPRSIATLRRRFPVGTFGFNGPMTHEHVLVFRKPNAIASRGSSGGG